MYRPETGNVDLMIRTGGEQRISNFLLWQMAYAELYFSPTKWPDFTVTEFKKILGNVSLRERRFGNVSMQNDLDESIETAEANKANYLKDSISDV
jgi:undecaprenyl diphosphate synthase